MWSVTDIAGNFGNYSSAAAYPAGKLYKNITIAENGKQVIVFKDKLGKIILSKVQLTSASDTGMGKGHSGWLCTYYVYDVLGNLRCVIQPRGVELILSNWILTDVTILAEQCFRYEYDYHNRLVMKKIPGSGKICMVYDARNRLVLEQDSLMRFSHKWLYTLYDSLNRPATTGLITDNANYNLLSYHAARADTSISYPNVALYTNEELTKTFYDDYTWLNNYTTGLTSALDNTVNGTGNTNLFTASNTVWPYPQLINQSSQLKGMVTGTRIKVLGTGTYMYSVNFYDDKGRNVQIKNTNVTTGIDITTTQYSWPGQPLMTIQKQEKAVTNAQTIVSVTRLTYDSLWRVSKTEKKISHSQVNGGSMPSAWIAISENEYNSLGQLKKKKLESTYNAGAGLDTLAYDYNIRGWLLGMNRNFAKDANNSNYFGFDLGYDKTNNNIIGNQLYTAPQFNGNIEGMVWKSKGDNEKRKYDFSYDAANRILAADFNQYTSGAFNKTAQVDFSLSGMAYDANGNILKMKQRGLKLSSSYTIDTLNYNYINKTNKLLNVIDGQNDPLTKLGDFRTATTHPNYGNKNATTTDYAYDANGNLLLDYNKGLTNIHYNHLNLPDSITVTGKGNY